MSERDRHRDRNDHIEAFYSTVQETYLGEAEQIRQDLLGEVRELWPIGDVAPGLAKPTAVGVSGG